MSSYETNVKDLNSLCDLDEKKLESMIKHYSNINNMPVWGYYLFLSYVTYKK